MGNITESYKTFAKSSPNKIAIRTNHQQISYQKWYELINQTANWLHSLHSENKTIGILLPNGIPFLQLFAGASKAGWIAVPYDMKWNITELEKKVQLSNPSIIVTTREIFSQIKKRIPNVMILDDLLQEIPQFDSTTLRKAEANLPFYIGFTSGTTGNPKAFVRSQDSWVASFDCNRFDFGLDESDHVLICGALIHSHFLYGAISTLYLGGTVFLLEKFSPIEGLAWIHSFRITTIYVVPTMLEAFLKEGNQMDRAIKIISSGAKWSEKSKLNIRNIFPNMAMYEFYGASELSFITVLSDKKGIQKATTVGKPCYGVEVQIRQPNQELAKPNETGKIYVRSKLVIDGYFDQDGRTIYSFQDDEGWATVHDMGYLDEDGFLYIVGRENNMILYGGINIFPEEIEKVISLHPNVEEVAVIGLSDLYWGQIVAAVVKGKCNPLELKRFCKTHLSSYKIPRKWFFLSEMPYTTSGKIARAELIKRMESKVTNH
ncbi:long-chain acyl-CoA synthetase [Neobacillus niacini]|uniref:AMP-binding protein n=1 Tax=Neobacillus niacini TaxID=86668 RepID=UPI002788C7D5|nr:AMP-binding protein [Neobacillus niacini]MDQ1000457.1 long-chain acyl-CoA synthetase [Neobacillus niacini]